MAHDERAFTTISMNSRDTVAVDRIPSIAPEFEMRPHDASISNGEDAGDVVGIASGVGEHRRRSHRTLDPCEL